MTFAKDLIFPAPGSQWWNDRRQKIFIVIGMVSPCEPDDWEILYRSDDMPKGCYRRRSLSEWHGLNRDGKPRFVLMG